MRIRPSHAAALLLTCLPLCARCDRAPERSDAVATASDTAVSALYRRRFLFVGGTPDSLVTALLHFTAAPEGERQVRHSAYGWIGSGIGWDPLLPEEWRGEPLRDPALILPHGEVRLVAGANDELSALQYGRARIERGTRLAEWAQPDAISLSLSEARLLLNGRPLDGALLSTLDAPESAGAAIDSAPAVEALLSDGAGAYVVLEQRGDVPASSLQIAEDGDGAQSGSLAIRQDPAGALDEDGRPTAWLIVDASGRTVGALHRIGPGWAGTSGQIGYRHFDGVRGDLQQGGRRRRVAGILERRAR